MKRIHIVGCGPRSGTTLLSEMMIACFDISDYGKHEVSLLTRPPNKRSQIYLTKKPMDILIAKQSLDVMKKLYIIYMVRDPRDMIVSKHGEDPDRYWAGLKFWKMNIPYGEKLENHSRFITVRYEDLVTAPDKAQKEIEHQLSFLRRRENFSDYHHLAKPGANSIKALKGVRPVSAKSVGNWRNHLPRVAGQIQLHGPITDDLIKYGYESDRNWDNILNDVSPDLNPSHWPEYFSNQFLRKKLRSQYLKIFWIALGHGLSMMRETK